MVAHLLGSCPRVMSQQGWDDPGESKRSVDRGARSGRAHQQRLSSRAPEQSQEGSAQRRPACGVLPREVCPASLPTVTSQGSGTRCSIVNCSRHSRSTAAAVARRANRLAIPVGDFRAGLAARHDHLATSDCFAVSILRSWPCCYRTQRASARRASRASTVTSWPHW